MTDQLKYIPKNVAFIVAALCKLEYEDLPNRSNEGLFYNIFTWKLGAVNLMSVNLFANDDENEHI